MRLPQIFSATINRVLRMIVAAIVITSVAAAGVHYYQASNAATPGVTVSGNRLYKDGQLFIPRGFTMIGLLTPPSCSQGTGRAAYEHLNQTEMNAAKSWGANTLRFQVSHNGLSEYTAAERTAYLERIKTGIALARSNGFVVILSLQDQSIGCGPARPLPTQQSIAIWNTLSNTFKADPYMIFQLWNEPDNEPLAARLATTNAAYDYTLTWPDWKTGRTTAIVRAPDTPAGQDWSPYMPVGHQRLVDEIRTTGATNVVMAMGSRKGERLEGLPVLTDPLANDQLAYSAHTYYFTTSRADWDFRFGYLADTKPLVVTEWNIDCASPTEQAMAQEHLDYLQEKKIGITPWGFDFMNTLISDWNYTPTSPTNCTNDAGGAIVKRYFLNYPTEATPGGDSLSYEAENGTPSGSAIEVSDTAASGGSGVKFGQSDATAMNVYFGSTHNHTGSGNDHGTDTSTTRDILTAAKLNNFDFILNTEHSGNSGPSSRAINPDTFYSDVKTQSAALTDATFVGIPGYEYSDNDGGGGLGQGHMTGVNTDTFMSADGTNNSQTLMDYLVAQRTAGKPAYGGFNHPGANGHPGSIVSLLTTARRNVVVMSEVHNSYESAADFGHLSGLITELDRGWRVAPVCGLDGHGLNRITDTRPEPGPCRTGLLASSLSKTNVDQAFMARRVYSSRDTNMQVKYKVNNFWMGSQIGTPTTLNFDITVSDPNTANPADKITKIEIITEAGVVVQSSAFDAHSVTWRPTIQANGKKYFMLKIYNGERLTYTAAAAPVWLE